MRYIFICFILLISTNLFAQKDSTSTKKHSWKFEKERLTFGGGVGGGISNGITSINVSPILAYKFTDKFLAGPRLTYNYYAIHNFRNFSNYGYGVLGRYFFKSNIFGHLEYEEMFYDFGNPKRNRVPSLLGGVGYYQRPLAITAMFDFLWNERISPYDSPLRVNFGLMF